MKNNLILFAIAMLFLSACGGEGASTAEIVEQGDLQSIRDKKKALLASLNEIELELKELDSAIQVSGGNKKLPLVTTLETNASQFDHFVELQGSVATRQNVLIYPEVSGMLIYVNVKRGDKVKKGQQLARIDDGGMKDQLAQMETQLSLAKTTFERQKRLWDEKIGSEIQYLQAKASYEAQESAVAQLKGQLRKFVVRAPFSGVIDDVIKEQGTVVTPGPGSEIFRIINLSNMYLEVDVPETYLTSVTSGKRVDVYFPVIDKSVVSSVRQTGNFIKPDNRTFKVEIAVPNQDGSIKPNLTGKVQINDYSNESAILIPLSVISENAEGDQYVYKATQFNESEKTAVASRSVIKTGKVQEDKVEILSGLIAGDRIIEEGARSVKENQEVKILNIGS